MMFTPYGASNNAPAEIGGSHSSSLRVAQDGGHLNFLWLARRGEARNSAGHWARSWVNASSSGHSMLIARRSGG